MTSGQSQKNELPEEWRLCVSKSKTGGKYYFNKKTGQSLWATPEITKQLLEEGKQHNNIPKEINKRAEKRKCDDSPDHNNSKQNKSTESYSKIVKSDFNEAIKEKTSLDVKESNNVLENASSTGTTVKSSASPQGKGLSPIGKNKKKLTKNLAAKRLSICRAKLQAEINEQNNVGSKTDTPTILLSNSNDTTYENPKVCTVNSKNNSKWPRKKKKNKPKNKSITNKDYSELETNSERGIEASHNELPIKLNVNKVNSSETLNCNKEGAKFKTFSSASARLASLRNELNETDNESFVENMGSGKNINVLSNNDFKKNISDNIFNNIDKTVNLNSNKKGAIILKTFSSASARLASLRSELNETQSDSPVKDNVFNNINKSMNLSGSGESMEVDVPVESVREPVNPEKNCYKKAASALKTFSYPSASGFRSELNKSQNYSSVKDAVVSGTKTNVLNNSDFISNNLFNSKSVNISADDEGMEIDAPVEAKTPAAQTNVASVLKMAESSGKKVELVVDTNLFIHDFESIKNILKFPIKGCKECPILMVPWRVLNELDGLKDNRNNPNLSKKARRAINFLHELLPEGDKVKGQSLRASQNHIFNCVVPDDEILNCCFQESNLGNPVILVTNDKNLSTKALVNGICASTIEGLNIETGDLSEKFELYQTSFYDLLVHIMETEMRVAYDNIWEHLLYKVPPWTLKDVVCTMLQNWYAVFRRMFSDRDVESYLKLLRSLLTNLETKKTKAIKIHDINSFKELAKKITLQCVLVPEYRNLAKVTLNTLQDANVEEYRRITL